MSSTAKFDSMELRDDCMLASSAINTSIEDNAGDFGCVHLHNVTTEPFAQVRPFAQALIYSFLAPPPFVHFLSSTSTIRFFPSPPVCPLHI